MDNNNPNIKNLIKLYNKTNDEKKDVYKEKVIKKIENNIKLSNLAKLSMDNNINKSKCNYIECYSN